MSFITCVLLGFIIAFSGSIVPSFLNLTVIKFSLRSGKISALYLVGGLATILFFQANIGAYLSNILMENSEYITLIQKVGTAILFLLSINFFRLHFNQRKIGNNINTPRAYLHGLGMALLNTFAIPFYFTTISFLIVNNYFEYSFQNSFYFSIGSTTGSFSLYAFYAILANKIEHKITFVATKIDFILGCLTGFVGIVNLIYLL